MEQFMDQNGAKVTLVFEPHFFPNKPEHVLVICSYKGKWLLTKHKIRGLEFPGGKVEKGESLEDAARREVYEETGAILNELYYIGEYEVSSSTDSFTKAIFFGKVNELTDNGHYFETDGPVFVDHSLMEKRFGLEYSFIMKDNVIKRSLEYIEKWQKGQA